MTGVSVGVVASTVADVGEGPVWDVAAQVLHWVDIAPGLVHRTDPASGVTTTVRLPAMVGAVALCSGGDYLAAIATGFARVGPDGDAVAAWDVLRPGYRMNDAKCDPRGRMWAGSVELGSAPGEGALHVLDEHGGHRVALDGLTLPNGMDWSPDGRTFYLVDSIPGVIGAYDIDPASGALDGQRTLVAYDGDNGLPDGLTVDADGCLWVALWGGAAVERCSPDGELLDRVALPVAQPTSCVFGGPELDTLYVTSATRGLVGPPGPADGRVLAVTGLGVRGRPPTPYGGAHD